jgi:hypothetical protein
MKSFGIVYLSFGKTYVDCTVAAIKSKIKNAPKTPATVITNRQADTRSKLCRDNGINVIYMDRPDSDVRAFKTQLYRHSPYEYTLGLDADAWVNQELAPHFGMLDYAPIALTHAFHHPSIGTAGHLDATDLHLTLKAVGGHKLMPQYASGLIFFRRDSTEVHRLYDSWYKEWLRVGRKDQGALLRAIVASQVFPLVLARKHWLTPEEGCGVVTHYFGKELQHMPRKDTNSPLLYKQIP